MNNPGHSYYGASPAPSQGGPSPDAESQPVFCLAPACPVLLPFSSGSYLFIYTVNVIKLQQETEAIPCHSPRASPGLGEQGGALCRMEPPASTEPVAEAEERAKCVCEHRDLVLAPTPGLGILRKKLHGASRAGGERAPVLAWDVVWEHLRACSQHKEPPQPVLGLPGNRGGTEDHLGWHVVAPWPSMGVYEQLFPELSQLGGSSNPSPASFSQLLQSAAAAISRVQSERLLLGLTWLLPP